MLREFSSQRQQLFFVVAFDSILEPIVLVVDLSPGDVKYLLFLRSPLRILRL